MPHPAAIVNPAPVDAIFDPSPVVALKFHGKAFICLCGSKTFRLPSPDAFRYVCTECKSVCSGEHYEAFQPPRNDWRTPDAIFRALDAEYHFTLDAAASAENTKCPVYYAEGDDALNLNWYGIDLAARNEGAAVLSPWEVRAFVNPPYQPKGAVETWLKKGLDQAAQGVFSVFLVPMATSVAWFNDLVVPYAEWHSFRGRIPFDDPTVDVAAEARSSPKQDNLLVIYDPKSTVLGHAAVRCSKTGERLWTRPDLLENT